MDDGIDFEALRPSGKAKLAGAFTALAGFWTLLLANQSHSIFRFEGVFQLIILLGFALAAGLFLCAYQIVKMRAWAVQGAMGVSAFTCLSVAGLMVFYFLNGVVTLMPMMVVPSAGAAAVFAFFALPDAKKADAVRASLEESGLDAGI